MKYLNFFVVLMLLAACDGNLSTSSSTDLKGTWIFTSVKQSSNVSGYFPDNRYGKYKYLDLYQNGKGSLWGGNNLWDGAVNWKEKEKWVELQAKDSSAVFMEMEKFTIDSVSDKYMHMLHIAYYHDTTVTKEFFLKK
ncbi:MAG: hypothetical protein ACKOXB_06480 [Flavobacteriales bacterium]